MLTSDNEGTPVSLIEAQAAGTPVVGTRVGGVATVVRAGGAGLVVDRHDEHGMAAAISQVLDDAGVASRAVVAGADVARGFSLDALVYRIDGLYRDLLQTE